MTKVLRGKRLVLGATLACIALATAACSSSKSGSNADGKNSAGSTSGGSSANCSGAAVKIMTISTLSGSVALHPEIPQGVESAAKALNTSCALGGPIQVQACDDKYEPNAAAACARKAVSDKVIAVVGDDGQFTDQSIPILRAAGIPETGFFQNGSQSSTSPNSFPTVFGIPGVYGDVSASVSLGATKVGIVSINTPATQYLVNLSKLGLSKLGAKLVSTVLVAPDLTDYSAAAAKLASDGAQAVIEILPEGGALQLLKALRSQGTDLAKVPYIASGLTVTPKILKKWTNSVTQDIYIVGSSWPTTDETNTGIKQLNTELRANGADPDAQSAFGIGAWAGMHMVADLMKGESSMTAATLMTKLKTATLNNPALAPVDFNKPAFPDDPTLSKQRVFSNQVVVSKVDNGKPKVISGGFVSCAAKFTVTQ
jgi:branched-chain amino acid transport system substrate-binding protein